MIENERGLEATRNWLRYWKSIVADGEQRWSGGENARAEVMRYARAISDYEKRQSGREGASEPGSAEPSPALEAPENPANM